MAQAADDVRPGSLGRYVAGTRGTSTHLVRAWLTLVNCAFSIPSRSLQYRVSRSFCSSLICLKSGHRDSRAVEVRTLRRCSITFWFCASCTTRGMACAKVMLCRSTGRSTSGASIEGSGGWCVCSERDGPDPSEGFESSCRRSFITCSDTPPPEASLFTLIAGSSVVLGAESGTVGSVVGGEC